MMLHKTVNVDDLLSLNGDWGPCPLAPDPLPSYSGPQTLEELIDLLDAIGELYPDLGPAVSEAVDELRGLLP